MLNYLVRLFNGLKVYPWSGPMILHFTHNTSKHTVLALSCYTKFDHIDASPTCVKSGWSKRENIFFLTNVQPNKAELK